MSKLSGESLYETPKTKCVLSRYTWQGTANLQKTIEHLRQQDLSQPCVPAQLAGGRTSVDLAPQQQYSNLSASIERREKSLGLLAQRFIQMLLCVTADQAVALDDAAKSLLGMLSPEFFAKASDSRAKCASLEAIVGSHMQCDCYKHCAANGICGVLLCKPQAHMWAFLSHEFVCLEGSFSMLTQTIADSSLTLTANQPVTTGSY